MAKMNYGKKSAGNTVKLKCSSRPTGGIFKTSSSPKSKSMSFKKTGGTGKGFSERQLRQLRKDLRKEIDSPKVQDYYKNKRK